MFLLHLANQVLRTEFNSRFDAITRFHIQETIRKFIAKY